MDQNYHLIIEKEKILTRWEALSREMFPAASDKSRAAVRDHLPQLLDALCEVLDTKILESPKELSKIHSRQRFSFGDYTLSQVLGEYALLKRMLFDQIESHPQFSIKDFRLINQFFDLATITAATEFARLREEEIKKMNGVLETSNLDLERFAVIAAHDLRSPVATIVSFAEYALEESKDLGKIPQEPVETIHRLGLSMIGLIDRLLEFSRIGKSDLAVRRFPLADAVQEAQTSLAKSIADTQATIEVGVLPSLQGDPVFFAQLFQNLIANSLKFKSQERPCRIQINAHQEPGLLKISVKDNGIGFDPKLQKDIFLPFKRGHTDNKVGGSGLGLATVQRIVERHGGTVTATGWPDQGAEFVVELPTLH